MPVKKNPGELTWIEIADFTPGIISNSSMSGEGPQNLGGNFGPVPGRQLGQAQENGTFGCIALPNGGLAPLPGVVTPSWNSGQQEVAPNHAPTTGTGSANMIVGFFARGPLSFYGATPYPQSYGDEIIVGQAAITSTGNLELWVDVLQFAFGASSAGWHNIIGPVAEPNRLGFATMTGETTRANSDPSLAGNPCWALAYEFFASAGPAEPLPGIYKVVLYPDPTSPGSFTPYVLSTSPADVLCHQNRIVTLGVVAYEWSAALTYQQSNEQFVYTDPPNGVATGSPEIFVQEEPFGYGAWGSISASELFLVKNNGGGVVISGDLNSPTVTALPGVTPTYGLMSRTAQTGIGLLYASANHGLWSWNGSNVSQKVSNQLDDNFFVIPDVMPATFRGPTVDICRWGDWVLVTNDWLMDTNTGAWWKLFSPNGTPHLWYQTSSDGSSVYAAIPVPTSSYFMDIYDRAVPGAQYGWTSYPIRTPSDTKNVNLMVREVVVRAQGYGKITATLYGTSVASGSSSPAVLNFELVGFSDAVSKPQMLRQAVGIVASDITIEIQATGGIVGEIQCPAPVIWSIAIGYQEQMLVSPT